MRFMKSEILDEFAPGRTDPIGWPSSRAIGFKAELSITQVLSKKREAYR
ncbi:hypothetical protein Bra471DRAFT_01586 [Bradyrhizobium sp. WSM471]|nr:hypothetical protein Bra471DRAFT_01586 [Bradyrhizobium sp. WSM471]